MTPVVSYTANQPSSSTEGEEIAQHRAKGLRVGKALEAAAEGEEAAFGGGHFMGEVDVDFSTGEGEGEEEGQLGCRYCDGDIGLIEFRL